MLLAFVLWTNLEILPQHFLPKKKKKKVNSLSSLQYARSTVEKISLHEKGNGNEQTIAVSARTLDNAARLFALTPSSPPFSVAARSVYLLLALRLSLHLTPQLKPYLFPLHLPPYHHDQIVFCPLYN